MSKFILTLSIEFPGEHTNAELLELLTPLEDAINETVLGRYVGSGAGMNRMDISYLVENELSSRAAMEEIVRGQLPQVRYSFEAEEFLGDESELFEEIESISTFKLLYFFGLIAFLFMSFLFLVWMIVAEVRN